MINTKVVTGVCIYNMGDTYFRLIGPCGHHPSGCFLFIRQDSTFVLAGGFRVIDSGIKTRPAWASDGIETELE